MAKAKQHVTRSPGIFGTGNVIWALHAQEVAEALNYAVATSPQVFINLETSPSGWGQHGSELSTHRTYFPTGNSLTEYYQCEVWIDPDAYQIEVGARCTFTTTETGDVKFTVGSANTTISYSQSDADEKQATLLVSATGSGWQTVTIEIQHTSGSGATQELNSIRVQEVAFDATNLASPTNE